MQLTINYKRKFDNTLSFVLDKMTQSIKAKICDYIFHNKIVSINEIRLKSDYYIFLIADSKNIKTDIFVNHNELEEILVNLCGNSVYAHASTIRDGYINVGQGIRASVCGRAIVENGIIDCIGDITSINIRIPQNISFAGNYIFRLLKEGDFNDSFLILSPPGIGKTTILRDLVNKISNYSERHIRFSIIDTRCEITPCLEFGISGDVYLSYPKGNAIELATRGMTPEYIICDEISSENEAMSILKSIHSGVHLIATTHASTYEELLSKEILKPLLNSKAFDYAVGVNRPLGQRRFVYSLHKLN